MKWMSMQMSIYKCLTDLTFVFFEEHKFDPKASY